MADHEVMTIGRFARLSGVSAHALRHYDDVDLLRPHEVDSGSGYRLYRHEQLRTARLIQALRNLGLSIENVRRILTADSDEDVASVLAEHRQRLARERNHLDVRIRDVDRYLERGLSMPVLQYGCRPVQIKIAVDDHASAARFYQHAFGLDHEVARRTEHEERRAIVFGQYGQDSFFLLSCSARATSLFKESSGASWLLVQTSSEALMPSSRPKSRSWRSQAAAVGRRRPSPRRVLGQFMNATPATPRPHRALLDFVTT